MAREPMDQALEALPALRRWLARSAGRRSPQEGSSPSPLSQVRTLIHLYQRGPLTMGELARGLGISCSTATGCVAGLEARGRVVRQRSVTDRRQVLVSLTPEAEAVASQVVSQQKVVIEGALRQLSPREVQAFIKGLLLLAHESESWMDRMPLSEPQTFVEKEVVRAA